jgi:hypothetical protein
MSAHHFMYPKVTPVPRAGTWLAAKPPVAPRPTSAQ